MTPEIEKHLMANGNLSLKRIAISNFIGGVFWGAGTIIGVLLVVYGLYYTLKSLNFIPYAGFAADKIKESTSIRK